ncbi:hypothetical protein IC611_01005 [Proteus mirabilis]
MVNKVNLALLSIQILKVVAVCSLKLTGKITRLVEKNTFIPLSPYSDYDIQLMNDGKSKDSFDIISGK